LSQAMKDQQFSVKVQQFSVKVVHPGFRGVDGLKRKKFRDIKFA